MHRSWLLTLGFLFASPVSFAQTASTDSQTLQALLAEVRQLRIDLQTTTVASQRVQIILYRLQLQEAAVARAQQRLDGTHAKLAEAQAGVRHFISENERVQSALNDSQNSADRKELEAMLARLKGELESQKSAEQEWATKDAEATQELRSEEAKLAALQDQFDHLDKILEQSSRPPAAARR
jgi:chromosome segregation ATPase